MTKNPGVRRLDSAESSDGPWSPAHTAVPGYAPEPGQIDELVVELAPRKSALNTMMGMVEAFGAEHSVSEVAIFRVNLELDELVTNYIVHRLPADWPARMVIRIRLFALRLVLVVADTGPPFDPQNVEPLPEPVGEEPPKLGGTGLHLVRSYADRFHYAEVDGCNILRLEHDLDPEPLNN